MITLNLTCVTLMDSDPCVGNSLRIELRIAPRFFIDPQHRPNDSNREDTSRPDRDRAEEYMYVDTSQSEALVTTGTTDGHGSLTMQFECADAWRRAGLRRHPVLGAAKDVVGLVTSQVLGRSVDLVNRHRIVLAHSPNAEVDATVVVDPAKLVIGHSSSTSARVLCWLHGPPKPGHRFALVRRGGQDGINRRTIGISNDAAHNDVVVYSDLSPDTTYHIELVGQSVSTLQDEVLARGSFRTRPRAPTRWTYDFGSCHLPTNNSALRSWQVQANRDPADLLILLGDQIYGDEVGRLTPSAWSWFARYVHRYEQLWAYQPMRNVLRRTPTVAMFDDHEVADDWGVAAADEIGRSRLDGAVRAYESIQGSLNPRAPGTEYYDFGFIDGRVAVYVLDERSHRGTGPPNNVLGRDQAQRFRSWCRSPAVHAADVVILGSPVPLAYLPSETLEDLTNTIAVGAGAVAGALIGGIVGGPAGAIIGGFLGAAGSSIAYDEVVEDIREPDLQDAWVHDKNQTDLSSLLDELYALAGDLRSPEGDRRPRAVFVLGGDVHVGGMHLIHSERVQDRRNRLIYQLISSPLSHSPASNEALNDIISDIGPNVDLGGAEFLKQDPDRHSGLLGLERFVLDSNGAQAYAAEFLGAVRERNVGRLAIEHMGQRKYRFQSTIVGRDDSLVTMFELDLDAAEIRPRSLIGQTFTITGTPTQLRVNDVGGGFGPSFDRLETEVVVSVDSAPGRAFGLPLRDDDTAASNRGMFDQLRDAFTAQEPVTLEYRLTGPSNGLIRRVTQREARVPN